jgi:hypothetical protein
MNTSWVKALATVSPLLIGALVGVAWTNSHSLTVQASLIARLTQDVEQLERRMIECQPK